MPDIEIDGKCHSQRSFLCLVCGGTLTVAQSVKSGVGLTGGHIDYALIAAGRVLGWIKDRCPQHLGELAPGDPC